MQQPQSFTAYTDKVCYFNKSIYGLKQSPKNCNNNFSVFKKHEIEETNDDPCVYYNRTDL